ncbi:diguanylate cyclase [Hoeflea sp. G2-23]|uniref:diguanylate cyclase n=1 Tax=Hoeflea algicola TaxID=2983763 RepID=A0ABT3Z7K6_9HYPH|nr:diguanylate cyclase [Hoeflea algicola]MCY0147763.1 diguanylate cyclase [Hoeflea algicola]
MPFRKPNSRSAPLGVFEDLEILLVEDSRTYIAALKQRLAGEYGMRVTSCSTLEILHSVLEEAPERFALALIDLNLPGAPAGEALDLLLSKNIPAIVFTATFSDLKRKQVLTKHVADYVLKDGKDAIENLVKAAIRILSNRGAHVLVVDDSMTMREMLSEQLLRQLYRVTAVASGEAALEALEEDDDFDLAVINYLMPEMNGLTLVEQIRQRRDFDQLRIIGMSSLEDRSLTARFLRAGANDFLHQPLGIEEFRWRVAQNIQTTNQVRQLRELAARDYLTGLYNRRYFFDYGPRRIALARKHNQAQSLAIVDIDHFKRLNDTYGHEIGDVALKSVAGQLADMCGNEQLLARLGGEEFGLLISGRNFAEAREFCERLRSSIEQMPITTADGELSVTISIGLAEIAPEEMFDNYLNAADQFLYMAKHAGRNCVFSETDIGGKAVA